MPYRFLHRVHLPKFFMKEHGKLPLQSQTLEVLGGLVFLVNDDPGQTKKKTP